MSLSYKQLFSIEALAVIFSIAYTVLITYGNILCWPFALTRSLLFIYLCFKKQLLAETTLHIFYAVMAIYGWFTWYLETSFEVHTMGLMKNIFFIVIGLALIYPIGMLLKKYTKAELVYIDTFTTLFSVLATFMMIHMVIENWFYWIIIDTVSIFLYAKRGLYLAAILYAVYTLLAVNGYLTWANG